MEYDFHKNIYGTCEVKLSMGHEAFASWMNDNLTRPALCDDILNTLKTSKGTATLNSRCGHYTLILQNGELHIDANSLSDDSEISEEDFDYYDNEASAHCGLEDFIIVIEAWKDFISLTDIR